MAVRFDASTDGFQLSSSLLDYNSPYTIMGYVMLSVAAASASVPICLALDGSNRDQIRTNSANTRWGVQANNAGAGANVTGAGTLSTGVWYHVALVRESTTSLVLYVDGAVEATNTQSVSGRSAQTRSDLGSDRGGSNWDGRFYGFKAWSAGLTQADILLEMKTIRPRRLANLYGWWPIRPNATERAKDYSGNGRSWTENGTLTDEAEPPIIWGSRQSKSGYVRPPISFTLSASSASTTPDTAALPVARGVGLAPSSASTTPDTVALLRAMAFALAASSASTTPDTATLLRALTAALSRSSASTTPDTAALISLVAFALARSSASTTPDTAALPVARGLTLNAASASTTDDTVDLLGGTVVMYPWNRFTFTVADEALTSQAKRTFPFVVADEALTSEAKRTFPFVVADESFRSSA